jgi:hypothetical protein
MEATRNMLGLKRRKAILLGSTLVLVVGAALYATSENDPVYYGKRLSKHLEAYSADGLHAGGALNSVGESTVLILPGIKAHCSDQIAREAVFHVGPKALPMLVRMLKKQDTRLQRWIWEMVESHKFLSRHIRMKPPTTGFPGQLRALAAFQELGPRAAPAIARIIPLLDDPDLAVFAIAAILSIQPERERDILALTNVLGMKGASISGAPPDLMYSSAILALSTFGAKASGAVPALFKCTQSTNGQVRVDAMYALVRIGAPAESVLPLIIAEIPKTNPPPFVPSFPPTATSVAQETKASEDYRALVMALYVLGELGQKATSALPAITNLHSYPMKNIQFAAADAGAKIRCGK